MTELAVHRYQFNCETQVPLTLNSYSGSMLRGAFGRALRTLVCVTKMEDCKSCLLYRQCAYPKIFEPPVPHNAQLQNFSAIPLPFVIEPPEMGKQTLKRGDTLSFNMVLIGQAIQHLPLITKAWQQALENGLGKGKSSLLLHNIVFEPEQTAEQVVYQYGEKERIASPEFNPLPLTMTDQISIQLKSPLRIQKKGKVLSNNMCGRDFLMALMRRYYLLKEFYGEAYQAPDFSYLVQHAEKIDCTTRFEWYEWQRYSSRQKQKMMFGGVVGELKLQGDLSVFLPMLLLGQWLHVGNKTTFGMGHYQITGE